VARLDDDEREVVVGLLEQTYEIVAPLHRDVGRREENREGKAANLATAISALAYTEGDKVRLDQEQAQATVVALTDVRLLLGERLGLRTDEDADSLQDLLETASAEDHRLHLAACYDFLTWLQESLIQALMS